MPGEPVEVTHVHAVRPERDHLAIQFPRISGYRAILPCESLGAEFGQDSTLILTPEMTGATDTRNAGIAGERVDLTVDYSDRRYQTVLLHLTKNLLERNFRDEDGAPRLYLYGQLRNIASQWLREYC